MYQILARLQIGIKKYFASESDLLQTKSSKEEQFK
jgi:hypothetical protein